LNFDSQFAARFEDSKPARRLPRNRRWRGGITCGGLATISMPCERPGQGLGITHVQLSSAQPLETVLFDFLKARAGVEVHPPASAVACTNAIPHELRFVLLAVLISPCVAAELPVLSGIDAQPLAAQAAPGCDALELTGRP